MAPMKTTLTTNGEIAGEDRLRPIQTLIIMRILLATCLHPTCQTTITDPTIRLHRETIHQLMLKTLLLDKLKLKLKSKAKKKLRKNIP